MTGILWIARMKKLTSNGDVTLKDIALKMGMSEQNLHKCIKRGSIETKYLETLSIKLGIGLNYFFIDEENILGPKLDLNVKGKGNKTVQGNYSTLQDLPLLPLNEKNSPYGEVAILKERIQSLEKLLEEKERLIQVLMKK